MRSVFTSFLQIVCFASVATASSFLENGTPPYLQQQKGRIDVNLIQVWDYFYFAEVWFGNSVNVTKTNLLLDTQNDWTFVASGNCSTCGNTTHKYPVNDTQTRYDFDVKNVREILIKGQSVEDQVCVVDTQNVAQCVGNLKFGVISDVQGLNADVDGVLGLRPQIQSDDYSIVAALYNKTLISKMEAYIDIKNKKLSFGDVNPSSLKNSSGLFVNYPSDNDQWVIKVRDIRYNSSSADLNSLNDTYAREARLDTAFPGISVPLSQWPQVEQYILSNVILSADVSLQCNQKMTFLNEPYWYCVFNTSCKNQALGDISLQFNGNEAFTYPPQSYAYDMIQQDQNGTNHTVCAIQLYGNIDVDEDYYTLGDRFLENYYVLFNYTNNSVGFNGYFYDAGAVEKPDNPHEHPTHFPLWAIILISAGIVGIILAICICMYIKQKNNSLRTNLEAGNYETLDQ